MNTLQQIRFIWKPVVFLVCLLPLLLIIGDAFGVTGSLGANQIEAILDRFGNWALRFIMIALMVTPLRRLTDWNWLSRFRRMLGLFTFFYAFMHFLTWLVLDQELRLSEILEDLIERPFITLGFIAMVLLTALAVTSFMAIRRRMGKRWQLLHNMTYVIGILGVWHYWWQVKKDITEPLIYAGILFVLLTARVIWYWNRRSLRAAA
ncbi:MAG: sulfoxide reductase heme-binding subunit YedZ [Gammaproteobacteria bacterium]|jgi:methionine sulfoxide reductase heme-binding subunit|nr:sulfoxide reductase heme-binding subunit YedZ [Gammaproteobacteria bacterium]